VLVEQKAAAAAAAAAAAVAAAAARVPACAISFVVVRLPQPRSPRNEEEDRTGEEEQLPTSEFALRSAGARDLLSCRGARCFSALLRFSPRAITPLVSDFRARGLPRNERCPATNYARRAAEADAKAPDLRARWNLLIVVRSSPASTSDEASFRPRRASLAKVCWARRE
jgi:hypothetical protein